MAIASYRDLCQRKTNLIQNISVLAVGTKDFIVALAFENMVLMFFGALIDAIDPMRGCGQRR